LTIDSKHDDELRSLARNQVNVLTLISGLVMVPLFYLWQQTLSIEEIWLPQWQTYLSSQPNSVAVIRAYFTSIGLTRAMPIDLVIWTYDISVILLTVTILILGAAQLAIDKMDLQRVQRLIEEGRRGFHLVLLFIIFFTIIHLLTTILFPFRRLLGDYDIWTIIGVGFATSIILKELLNRHIKEILGVNLKEKS
jgi:hypothetical protein